MYKSKYEIPLLVNNPGGYKEKSPGLNAWEIAKLTLQFFQSLVVNVLHLIWAVLFGLFSFVRSVWRENPWIKSLPWIRLSVLLTFGYFVLGGYPGLQDQSKASYSNTPTPPKNSAALLVSTKIEKTTPENNREKDLTPIAPALLKNPDVQGFINRFKEVAREEMKLYGIPASIKMGQAIIESQAGRSVLATTSNNYFGIKCKAKCLGCTCKNYADDNKYDMFRVFDSAWESWRAHSTLLCNPRYQKLPLYGKDYKKWAKGLKKAGYATDPAYAEKLISVIEKYNLTMLDQ